MTSGCATCILLVLTLYTTATAQEDKYDLLAKGKSDITWIEEVLASWENVCKENLDIGVQPLPWIIFYDKDSAWHLGADKKLLPVNFKLSRKFRYNNVEYQVYKISHHGGIWVPDRDPISLESLPCAAMPYNSDKKTFFVASLPSLFHTLAPASEELPVNLLLLGTNIHELVHTRQLNYVLPQLLQIQKNEKLPESIDDNILENTFNKDEKYTAAFMLEKKHYWKAALAQSRDSCLTELKHALSYTKKRHSSLIENNKGYAALDNIFLALEGSAMFAQYQIVLKHAGANQNHEPLFWLLRNTPSWSQEQGLALFILIDRLIPEWTIQFFGKPMPSPFDILDEEVNK